MKLKFAICDDNQTDIGYLQNLILSWTASQRIESSINTFHSAEAFLFSYVDCKDYDVLLLDIEMKQLNGIELAKLIRRDNQSVQIIFITGYPDYLAEGYDVSALHYLIKPVKKEKLFEVLNRAITNLVKSQRTVIFSLGSERKRVFIDSVVYAEAFSHSISITTLTDVFEVKMTMGEMEKILGEGFVRCHRSYIVGIRHISCVNKSEVTLDTGKKVPVSRSAITTVHNAFINYYKE